MPTERETYQAALMELIGCRPVAYWPSLARKVGGVKAAVMLSQLLYWHGDNAVQKRDGWLFKSVADMERETGLTKREQQSARRSLLDRRIIQLELRGMQPVWHYKVDLDSLGNVLIGTVLFPMQIASDANRIGLQSAPKSGTKAPRNRDANRPELNKELKTTTETTTKITSSSSSSNDIYAPGPDDEDVSKSGWPVRHILEGAGLDPQAILTTGAALRFVAWWLYALGKERIEHPEHFALSRVRRTPDQRYQQLAQAGPRQLYHILTVGLTDSAGVDRKALKAMQARGLSDRLHYWLPVLVEIHEIALDLPDSPAEDGESRSTLPATPHGELWGRYLAHCQASGEKALVKRLAGSYPLSEDGPSLVIASDGNAAWLQSRAVKSIQRELVGFTNTPDIAIEFVEAA